jgi:membrane protein DedA with SNARE-associated domain
MSPQRNSETAFDRSTGGNAAHATPRDLPPLVRTMAAAGVLAVVVLAQVGLVLAPSQLTRHPLLVLALRPTPAFLVLISDLVAPLTAILMASAARTMVDMAYFAVARYGALPVAERFGVGRNVAGKVSQRTASHGLLATSFFWSSTPVVAAIGLGRTPALRFLAVTGIGNIVTSAAFAVSGHQFSDYVTPITSWVSAHGMQLTIAVAVAVAVSSVVALRRTAQP